MELFSFLRHGWSRWLQRLIQFYRSTGETSHDYTGLDFEEFEDARSEGETDAALNDVRNPYSKGTPGWHGYQIGVRSHHRPNWEAHYHDHWY